MEKKEEDHLSEEEYNRRADRCMDDICRMIQSIADENGLTVDEVWHQFLQHMIEPASRLDPQGNPLPEDYDPLKDSSHPMHGWRNETEADEVV